MCIKTITVPPRVGINDGWIKVDSDTDFISASQAEHHRCAGVSIYNPLSTLCANDANTAGETQLLINNTSYIPSCAAWRNTDSADVTAGGIIRHQFGLGKYHRIFGPGPVEIEVQTLHVPIEWYKNRRVIEIQDMLRSGGVKHNSPMFLWPAFKDTLKGADLKIGFKMSPNSRVEGITKGDRFIIKPKEDVEASFIVSGKVPKAMNHGDVILMKVIAHYPQTGKLPGRSVEFLQVFHVKDGLKVKAELPVTLKKRK